MGEFRGSNNGNVRKKILDALHQNKDIDQSSYDVAISSSGKNTMNTRDEFDHKYILMIDGHSVRDAFHKQSIYASVIYKDVSKYKEWWYYDLVDGEHVLFYDNVTHLMSMHA